MAEAPTGRPARAALAAMLDEAAAGNFPATNGNVVILPQPSARDAGVIAFTGHTVVFTDADVRAFLAAGFRPVGAEALLSSAKPQRSRPSGSG